MKVAMLIKSAFHAWERRLASVTTDRVVRPFDWGLEWIPPDAPPSLASISRERPREPAEALAAAGDGPAATEAERIASWIDRVMTDTDAFFTPAPIHDYTLSPPVNDERHLTFSSALETPHPANNTVHCRYFPTPRPARGGRRAGVLVLPQWNADPDG